MSSTIRASAGWIRVSATSVLVRSRAPGIPESFSLEWNCSFRNEDPAEQEGKPSFFSAAAPGPVARRSLRLQLPVRIRSKTEEQAVLQFLTREAYSVLRRGPRLKTKPKSWLATGVGVFLFYSAFAQAPPSWVGKYQEAVNLLRGGNLAAATEAFERLWKANPQQYSLANAIGTALDSAG